MRIEQPPELWEADTEDVRLLPMLGELIAAALSTGTPLSDITLNASNVVVEDPEDGGAMAPAPGDYVALTVRGIADFGPDDTWRGSPTDRPGLLGRLHDRLATAGAKFAYVRSTPPTGSVTVFFGRVVVA